LVKILVKEYIENYLGVPYLFGGQTPFGFDCSGLIVEAFRAIGLLDNKFDTTAQGLYAIFSGIHRGMGMHDGELGALVFFGKNKTNIEHVGFCINALYMYEAGGGNSSVTDTDTAKNKNAFVRMRPIKSRGDLVSIILPFY